MRSIRMLAAVVAAGAIVGAVALVLTGRVASAATVNVRCPGAPQRAVSAPGAPDGIIGIPAIRPRDDCTPSFTAEDVRAYIATHTVLIQSPGAPPPTITRVQFMTSRDASQLMHGESIGLADDAIVCYVELTGSFMPFSVPFGVTPRPSHTGVVLFDAHNGNILTAG